MFRVWGVPHHASIPQGQVRLVVWHRGRLAGDPDMVALVEAAAAQLEGQRVGPEEGPYTRSNHLRSALSAAIIMADQFFTDTVKMDGDLPERPALEPGEIG